MNWLVSIMYGINRWTSRRWSCNRLLHRSPTSFNKETVRFLCWRMLNDTIKEWMDRSERREKFATSGSLSLGKGSWNYLVRKVNVKIRSDHVLYGGTTGFGSNSTEELKRCNMGIMSDVQSLTDLMMNVKRREMQVMNWVWSSWVWQRRQWIRSKMAQ